MRAVDLCGMQILSSEHCTLSQDFAELNLAVSADNFQGYMKLWTGRENLVIDRRRLIHMAEDLRRRTNRPSW